jgi:orotate phosphoribosyltransferase
VSERQELLQMIRDLSYEEREVTLASGRKSNFYIDMRNTLLHPRGCYLVSKLISEDLKSLDGVIQAVAGMTMGADPITTGVSLASLDWQKPLMACYIRKEIKQHGTGRWVEGLKNVNKGDAVYVLEDTLTTGGSSLKAAEKAGEAGLLVKGIYACVDREEGAREKIETEGLELKCLFTRTDIIS